MKKNVISTITKSLPIEFSSLVNYSLLVTLCYINLFYEKRKRNNWKNNIFKEVIPPF